MNATFFALAFLAALNPKLFAVDLLFVESQRPRLMFLCFLLGGLTMCLAHRPAGRVRPARRCHQHPGLGQRGARPGPRGPARWPSARCWPPAACTAGSGHPPPTATGRRRRTAGRSGSCASPGPGSPCCSARWPARRAPPTSPRCTIWSPSKSSTATQAIAVVIFALIEFSLVIIPFAFLMARPEGTKVRLEHAQAWLMSHARQLMAAVAIFVGGYMAISGLVRLLG